MTTTEAYLLGLATLPAIAATLLAVAMLIAGPAAATYCATCPYRLLTSARHFPAWLGWLLRPVEQAIHLSRNEQCWTSIKERAEQKYHYTLTSPWMLLAPWVRKRKPYRPASEGTDR